MSALLILAIIVGVSVAVGASGFIIDEVWGGFAASEAAKNERKNQERNLERFYRDRELLFKKFDESRGSTGNAFMPLYFGTGNQSFEKRLADDYRGLYGALAFNPSEFTQKFQETGDLYMPMRDAARGTAEGIFSGTLTEARREAAAPVMAARTALAKTQKQGVLEGLQERLNALNAAAAKSGFQGTGSFAQNRLLGATIGARQAAAHAEAEAALANAADMRGIDDAGQALKLQNLFTPYQLQQAELAYMDMPAQAAIQAYMDRLRPMEAFRIGTAMPEVPFTPSQASVPSSKQIWLQTGENISRNVNDAGMALLSAYAGGGIGGMGGGGQSNRTPTYTGSGYGGWPYVPMGSYGYA